MQQVTVAVIRRNAHILIAKRKPGKHLGAKWELPGGKVDPGERADESLRRELKEEFSTEAVIGSFLGSAVFDRGDIKLKLLAYQVELVSDPIALHEHSETRWVLPEELDSYDLVDSDRALIHKLLEKL